jgi:hypothetical protein
MKPFERELQDLENIVKLVKKLSNEVVDLTKNVDEGPSRPISFWLFFKRNDNPPKPLEVLQIALNMDNFGMDNLCSYH